jgi:hypothetical protein
LGDVSQVAQNVSTAAYQFPALVEWFAKLTPIVTLVIALFAAAYTAVQYERLRKWRAKDLAAGLVDQLVTDDELAFACQALDWGSGPMIVPTRYRPLLAATPADPKNPTSRELGAVMDHDTTLMGKALEVNLRSEVKKQPAGLIYRYCFDKLFTHLANVHRLLLDGQVQIEDLDGLRYWIIQIANYSYGPEEKRGGLMFQPFACYQPFGTQGVRELGKKLGIGGWLPKPPPGNASQTRTP